MFAPILRKTEGASYFFQENILSGHHRFCCTCTTCDGATPHRDGQLLPIWTRSKLSSIIYLSSDPFYFDVYTTLTLVFIVISYVPVVYFDVRMHSNSYFGADLNYNYIILYVYVRVHLHVYVHDFYFLI